MNKNSLKIEFESNPSKNYIVTYLDNREDVIDYEVEMIDNNPTCGALFVETTQFNDKIKVIYDTTGKLSIKEYLKGRVISRGEFISILKNMAISILEGKNYFLDESKYYMDLDTIYISEKDLNVYLLYFPFKIVNEENVNLTYRNIVKSLIIDFVSIEEKTSLNIIQDTLKYIRNDEFTIAEFKDYLEKLENKNFEVPKEEKVKLEPVEVKVERENIIEKPAPKNEQIGKYILITLVQLIALGLLGTVAIFETPGILMIISIAILVLIDAATVTFVLVNNQKNRSLSTKRKAETSVIGKDKNRQRTSKREIVTEMSFDTVILDAKTAFLISKKAGTVEKIFINKDRFKIGRLSGEVDYVSDNKAIGKLHAEIKKDNDKYYLIDLNSKNGTYINGQRLKSNAMYEIKNGDNIVFANSEYEFSIS